MPYCNKVELIRDFLKRDVDSKEVRKKLGKRTLCDCLLVSVPFFIFCGKVEGLKLGIFLAVVAAKKFSPLLRCLKLNGEWGMSYTTWLICTQLAACIASHFVVGQYTETLMLQPTCGELYFALTHIETNAKVPAAVFLQVQR